MTHTLNRIAETHAGQRGFTLLESMVSMFILSFALLALAAMQSIALVYNVDADELGKATSLATEMIERIQFNRQNVATYHAINTDLADPCPNSPGGTPPPNPTSRGDCVQWQTNLNRSGLNSAQGRIVVVRPTDPPANILGLTGVNLGVVNPLTPVALNQNNVAVTVNWMTQGQGLSGTVQKRSRPARVTLLTVVTPP